MTLPFQNTPARAQDLRSSFDVAMPIFLLIDPMQGEPLPGMVIEADLCVFRSLGIGNMFYCRRPYPGWKKK